jgi:hypothetical protein
MPESVAPVKPRGGQRLDNEAFVPAIRRRCALPAPQRRRGLRRIGERLGKHALIRKREVNGLKFNS